jgi:hydrogenase maturation protease
VRRLHPRAPKRGQTRKPFLDLIDQGQGDAQFVHVTPTLWPCDDGAVMRTLVLGMGNPILCDDAVGIRLARDFRTRLETELHRPPDTDIVEDCSVGGLNLLDLVMGYERLIVFDSIRTPKAQPGSWTSMTGATFRETMNLTNIHDANFTTALELGRQMGACIPNPEDVHIFAVEILDNTTFSETMTPELESAYADFSPEIIDRALALLRDPPSRGQE